MAITIIRPTQRTTYEDGWGRNAVVKNNNGQHFLISEVHRPHTNETLVFRSDAEGNVINWGEVFSADSIEGALQAFRG